MSDLMTVSDVAAQFSVNTATVWRWAKHTEITGFPKPIKLGRRCSRWKRDDVEAYINSNDQAA